MSIYIYLCLSTYHNLFLFFHNCSVFIDLTPQTIKVLLPFVAFVFFGFLARNKAVWIYVVAAIIAIDGRGAIEERHYPSHHMSSEDDE